MNAPVNQQLNNYNFSATEHHKRDAYNKRKQAFAIVM